MNDIFKIFKKRAQSGKSTNLTDVIKDLNEKEQNEIIGSDVGQFDRGNRSYLSISKSGRLKSKKSHNVSRILNEDLFAPAAQNSGNSTTSVVVNTSRQLTFESVDCSPTSSNELSTNKGVSIRAKPIYDQYSDNADSSTSSSFRSSLEDLSSSLSLNNDTGGPSPAPNNYNLQQQPFKNQISTQQQCYLVQNQPSFTNAASRLQVKHSSSTTTYSTHNSHNHYSTTISTTKNGTNTAYSFTKVHRRV